MTKNKKLDIILVIILLSYFMILLDNSIIFTGTIKISQNLNLNEVQLSWITNAYALTFGGFLLLIAFYQMYGYIKEKKRHNSNK